MNGLGLTTFQLGWYFASTVFIVFAAGFLAPRLAHRWGQRAIGTIGISIALAGSVLLFGSAAAPALMPFTMAIALYLLGMGLINPLGTAIALHPFGKQAGLASALLGFLQMGCAAIGASIATLDGRDDVGGCLKGAYGVSLIAVPVRGLSLDAKDRSETRRDTP